MLTQKRVKALFIYRDDGALVRKVPLPYCKDVYLGTDPTKYAYINVDKVTYRLHRIVWLYHKGYLPEHGIDHKDRIKSNTKIQNLREATQVCNMRNTGLNKNNKSGVKGVCWFKSLNKWHAQMTIQTKNKNLGLYKDFDNAVCARLAGEQCVDWAGCDFNSPAYLYVQENILNNQMEVC